MSFLLLAEEQSVVDAGSGALTLAGSSTDALVFADAASGAVVLAGTAADASTATDVGSISDSSGPPLIVPMRRPRRQRATPARGAARLQVEISLQIVAAAVGDSEEELLRLLV